MHAYSPGIGSSVAFVSQTALNRAKHQQLEFELAYFKESELKLFIIQEYEVTSHEYSTV